MAALDDALTGFYARASQDGALKSVLGTKAAAGAPARLYEGWPADEPTDNRATYFLVNPTTRRPGIYSVRIQVDGWFQSGPGGAGKRQQFTSRMLGLFDEAHWSYGAARLYSTVTGPGRDFPAPPGRPLRRLMEIRVEVSD